LGLLLIVYFCISSYSKSFSIIVVASLLGYFFHVPRLSWYGISFISILWSFLYEQIC
jgi:hypothetical protein